MHHIAILGLPRGLTVAIPGLHIAILMFPTGIQEASKRLSEASRRFQEAFKRLLLQIHCVLGATVQPSRFLLQIHCVLQSLFDGASNPFCFRGDGGAAVPSGRVDPPTRERLQEANLTHKREGLEA